MIAINRRQVLLSGVFLWLFAVAGTTLVALTEYSTSEAIVENERQVLLRNLYALLPRDSSITISPPIPGNCQHRPC